MAAPTHDDPAPDADRQDALVDLVATTRELMLAVGRTDATAAELRRSREVLQEVTRTLAARARPGIVRADSDGPTLAARAGRPWTIARYNPYGLPLEVRFDEGGASAVFTADALAEGPPGCVHGGVSAWLMDTMLGVLVQAEGVPSVTGTLDLRFLAPTPLGCELELRSRVTERAGRRTRAEGWVAHEGRRTVEAVGTFYRYERPVP